MKILELLTGKREDKGLGTYECSEAELVESFTMLIDYMNMQNPSRVAKTAGKAVSISKNGDVYTLKLLNFVPPIEIKWTDATPLTQLHSMLKDIAETQTKVAYMNTKSVESVGTVFQLALA